LEDAYTWDPATQVEGVVEDDVLGVESLLWTETVETMEDIEFMTFPRLAGHAENRLVACGGEELGGVQGKAGAHGARWAAM